MATPADKNYAPPESAVADVAADDVLAGRGSRLGAAFIDGLLYSLPFVPSYIAVIPQLAGWGGGVKSSVAHNFAIWGAIAQTGLRFYMAILVCAVIAIINLVLVQRNAQSIGKKLVGIKVARMDGSRATLARIFFLRNVLNTVIKYGAMLVTPILGSLYGLIDILFIFGNARRCVHDYIADTIVIKA